MREEKEDGEDEEEEEKALEPRNARTLRLRCSLPVYDVVIPGNTRLAIGGSG